MFTGKDAFPSDSINPMVTFTNIKQGIQSLHKVENELAKDLIQQILLTDPNERLSIHEIKNHALFQDINFNTLIDENIIVFNEKDYEMDLFNNRDGDIKYDLDIDLDNDK